MRTIKQGLIVPEKRTASKNFLSTARAACVNWVTVSFCGAFVLNYELGKQPTERLPSN